MESLDCLKCLYSPVNSLIYKLKASLRNVLYKKPWALKNSKFGELCIDKL